MIKYERCPDCGAMLPDKDCDGTAPPVHRCRPEAYQLRRIADALERSGEDGGER